MITIRSAYRWSPALLILLPSLGACNALLGEDISTEPDPKGSGGDNGDGDGDGDGGKSSGGNSSSGDGDGDKASGGMSGDGDGDGGGDGDGDGDTASGGTSGDGDGDGDGTGGQTGEPGDVTGRVVDFFMRPLPDIEVTIDGVGTAITDDSGEFSIGDVPDKYSVEFVPNVSGEVYSWRFVGLSRRDPTLQIYSALPTQSEWTTFKAFNPEHTADAQMSVSFAAPVSDAIDDITESSDASLTDNGLYTSVDWRGPATINTRAHGLQWAPGSPAQFYGYTSFNVTLATDAEVLLNSWTALPTPGTVAGTIADTSSLEYQPDLMMFLGFDDGAYIPILETDAGLTYSESVPVVNDDESITVALVLNYGVTRAVGSYAGIQPNTGLVPELALPTPTGLTGPSNSTSDVTSATIFKWSASSHSKCAIFYVEDVNVYQGTRIVTCDGSANISEATLDNVLSPDTLHRWSVESHGEFDSMDELASDAGFIDSFGPITYLPQGKPKPGPGYYTESETRGFYTAP